MNETIYIYIQKRTIRYNHILYIYIYICTYIQYVYIYTWTCCFPSWKLSSQVPASRRGRSRLVAFVSGGVSSKAVGRPTSPMRSEYHWLEAESSCHPKILRLLEIANHVTWYGGDQKSPFKHVLKIATTWLSSGSWWFLGYRSNCLAPKEKKDGSFIRFSQSFVVMLSLGSSCWIPLTTPLRQPSGMVEQLATIAHFDGESYGVYMCLCFFGTTDAQLFTNMLTFCWRNSSPMFLQEQDGGRRRERIWALF